MKTCIFVCYCINESKIDSKDIFFVKTLTSYFDEVIVSTNTKVFPAIDKTLVKVYKNEGYDFGFWYNALKDIKTDNIDTLCFINNSNYLVKENLLNKALCFNSDGLYDFWGITDSRECPPAVNPDKSYHVQSHFMVFEKKAIPILKEFFEKIEIEKYFTILKKSQLRRAIIDNCEIGLSQFMLEKKIKIGAVFSCNSFIKEHSERDPKKTNMHVWLWEELLKNGYPFIKKKIVKQEWKFLPNIKNHTKYIK